MNKTVFILISIALLLFMLFVPNYNAPDAPDGEGKWEFPNIELRAFLFATIILPIFFLITYSNSYQFNIAPTYFGSIERKNLWGTVAFVVLCASSVLSQLMAAGSLDEFALEGTLIIFSIVATVLLAIRSVVLDGLWALRFSGNFEERCTKFFRTVIILLFVVAVALAFVLPLLGVTIPSTSQIDQMFPEIQFAINEEFTATFCMLIVAGALALVVVVFALNQVLGLFGGVTAAVSDVAHGDFGGHTKRSPKVNCHNCKSFYINNNGKPCCYICGKLGSTSQRCPYYEER